MLRKIRANISEVQNLSEFDDGELLCPHGTRPYVVVCFTDLSRVERRLESAEPGLMVMAVILAIVMIATIISLGLYVRHLRKKIDYSRGNLDDNLEDELDRPPNTGKKSDSPNQAPDNSEAS